MPASWSRRRALKLLGAAPAAGLPGCLSGPVGSVGTPTSAGPPPGAGPVDLTFTASVQQSFTDRHPGRVSITLANAGDEPLTVAVVNGVEGPLSIIEGVRDGGGERLFLLPDPPEGDHETPPGAPCESGEYAIPDEPTADCWQPACRFARVSAHYFVPLEAGETRAWPYVVLDGFNEECLPSGIYVFASRSPAAVGVAARASTPPGGPTHYLNKRVTIELDDDGTVTAEASLDPRPVGADPEPAGTDPETPRTAAG